jgi:pimeloyl-ACP methyl ester carboxylesterase
VETGVEPEVVHVEHDGLRIGALDWGGDGPPLLLLHPNGFCAGVFDPLAQVLHRDYRVIGIDVRGHGLSDAPEHRSDCTFTHAAGDVLAVLDAMGISEVVALGESLGGAGVVLVDELRPGTVRRALLCEAIAMALPDGRPGAPELPGGGTGDNPMVAVARRRRAVWADRATVRESYGSRPPLDVLEPAVLAGYVRWGFRDRPDGQVELSCPPEVEAWYFEGGGDADGAPRAFAHLPSFSAPATVVCGDGSNLAVGIFRAQAEALAVPLVTVHGTHFFVQEDTERAAALVREHLQW